jgi:hypothetical protein
MSELGAIQPQKENDIGGGYVEGEATKYRRRKKHSAYLQIIFKRRKIEKLCFWPLR